jgi:hypothetical protein
MPSTMVDRYGPPAYEVKIMAGGVVERRYRIWENGLCEGFEDGDKAVMIINRIPLIVREAINKHAENPNA